MSLEIAVELPPDPEAHRIYRDLLQASDSLEVNVALREAFSPDLLETLVIAVSAPVAATYLVRFFDFLAKTTRRRKATVHIVIIFDGRRFAFPDETRERLEHCQSSGGEESE